MNYAIKVAKGIESMDIYDKINELYDKKREIELGGGDDRIAKQHEKGKLTARERIDLALGSRYICRIESICHTSNTGFWDGQARRSWRRGCNRLW